MSLHALVIPPPTRPIDTGPCWSTLLLRSLGGQVRLLLTDGRHLAGAVLAADPGVLVVRTSRGQSHLPAHALCGLETVAGLPVERGGEHPVGPAIPPAVRLLNGRHVQVRTGGHTLVGEVVAIGHDCLAIAGFGAHWRWVPWQAVISLRTAGEATDVASA